MYPTLRDSAHLWMRPSANLKVCMQISLLLLCMSDTSAKVRAAMLSFVLFFLILVSSPCVLSISVPSASRLTDGDASWDLAIRKGSMLFHELQSGCYPDKVNPLNLKALLAVGFHIGDEKERRWPPTFKARSGFEAEVVKFLKWTEKDGAFWTAGVWRTCTSLISLLQCYASLFLHKYLSIITLLSIIISSFSEPKNMIQSSIPGQTPPPTATNTPP